jgi:hypothetical protein
MIVTGHVTHPNRGDTPKPKFDMSAAGTNLHGQFPKRSTGGKIPTGAAKKSHVVLNGARGIMDLPT